MRHHSIHYLILYKRHRLAQVCYTPLKFYFCLFVCLMLFFFFFPFLSLFLSATKLDLIVLKFMIGHEMVHGERHLIVTIYFWLVSVVLEENWCIQQQKIPLSYTWERCMKLHQKRIGTTAGVRCLRHQDWRRTINDAMSTHGCPPRGPQSRWWSVRWRNSTWSPAQSSPPSACWTPWEWRR